MPEAQANQTWSSTIQVLSVENEERTSKRTGNKFQHFAARCIVLNDDGSVLTVGALRIRNPELQAACKPGIYRASFGLQVPDFGEDKGDIIAAVTALLPVMSPKHAASAAAVAK